MAMLYKTIVIILSALAWLFYGPSRKRFQKAFAFYQYGGFKLGWQMAKMKFSPTLVDYKRAENSLNANQSDVLLSRCSALPLISLVVPVYKVERLWLEKCFHSVTAQFYSNWELILIDDNSESEELKDLIQAWKQKDSRVKGFFLDKNLGIGGATNVGIKHATGKFVGFLDHDDELTPDALMWVIWSINQRPEAHWFYSDEDLITPSGKCHNPHFKPDFSPENLLSHMFPCHFSVYSKEVLQQVGGLREGYDGAQDHDLALRVSEITKIEQVVHIPRILYHWRVTPNSTASDISAKPKAPAAGRKAIAEALKRRNLQGDVRSHPLCPTLYQIRLRAQSYPQVSIIIPNKNNRNYLERCLNSIFEHTTYPNFEIVIIDNQSDEKSTLSYLAEVEQKGLAKTIQYNKPFNHSEMNNLAAAETTSELLVFMNNDIEIITSSWLDQLVATIQMDQTIGVVGNLLLYPDGTVQHGGILLGLNDSTGHSHQFIQGSSPGYNCRLHSLQGLSAVTAALMLVRRSSFNAVDGFDSNDFPILCNDVDLCLRLAEAGYRCVYNPSVRAIHHETKTRAISGADYKYKQQLKHKYLQLFRYDPFYNPNLSLQNEHFFGYRKFPVEDQILILQQEGYCEAQPLS